MKWFATILFASLVSLSASASWLEVKEGEVVFDVTGKAADDYEANMRYNATLKFELVLREGIKAVIKAKIYQDLYKNGQVEDWQKLNWEKVIEDAYIQIDTEKFSGLPRAIIIIGKHKIAFGQGLKETPFYQDELFYKLAQEKEVVGMTVTLPTKFLKVVDSIAVSLFEVTPGDFEISEHRGASVQLSKKINSQIQAQVSALVKENGTSQNESRASVGFVFSGVDGNLKVWAQGLVFDHAARVPDSRYGYQVGASFKVGTGTVVVDYQSVENYASELVVAYNIPVGQYLVISPEVRQTWSETAKVQEDTRIGIRTRIDLLKAAKKKLRKG